MPGNLASSGGKRKCPLSLVIGCVSLPPSQPGRQIQADFLSLAKKRSGAKLITLLGISFGSFLELLNYLFIIMKPSL